MMNNGDSRRNFWRGLASWLIIVPVVLLILFGCGQLALLGRTPVTLADTRSQLAADYGPWEFVVIPNINPDILTAILQDQARETPVTEPSGNTPPPIVTAIALVNTATPAAGTSVNPNPSASAPPGTIASPTESPVPVASNTAAPTPTNLSTATHTNTPVPPTPTRRPTRLPTFTFTPTETATFVPTSTNTNPPPPPPNTNTPVPPPPTNTPVPPPPTNTPVPPPPTPTNTATVGPPPTPSNTPLPTFTPTSTDTPTDTPTPTDTSTPTDTPTPTITPTPCSGTGLFPGEPDLTGPDGSYATVPCGGLMVVDLGAGNTISTTHAGYDFDYYEVENPVNAGNIALDWVIVSVCPDPLCITSYQVFNWGDNILDSNTSIGAAGYGGGLGEPDNAPILMSPPQLVGPAGNVTGIEIDVSGVAPPGSYQYVGIYSPPFGGNDPTDVDAVVVLP